MFSDDKRGAAYSAELVKQVAMEFYLDIAGMSVLTLVHVAACLVFMTTLVPGLGTALVILISAILFSPFNEISNRSWMFQFNCMLHALICTWGCYILYAIEENEHWLIRSYLVSWIAVFYAFMAVAPHARLRPIPYYVALVFILFPNLWWPRVYPISLYDIVTVCMYAACLHLAFWNTRKEGAMDALLFIFLQIILSIALWLFYPAVLLWNILAPLILIATALVWYFWMDACTRKYENARERTERTFYLK